MKRMAKDKQELQAQQSDDDEEEEEEEEGYSEYSEEEEEEEEVGAEEQDGSKVAEHKHGEHKHHHHRSPTRRPHPKADIKLVKELRLEGGLMRLRSNNDVRYLQELLRVREKLLSKMERQLGEVRKREKKPRILTRRLTPLRSHTCTHSLARWRNG
jgi:cobalamin biosynthesis protein CobT